MKRIIVWVLALIPAVAQAQLADTLRIENPLLRTGDFIAREPFRQYRRDCGQAGFPLFEFLEGWFGGGSGFRPIELRDTLYPEEKPFPLEDRLTRDGRGRGLRGRIRW